MTILEKFLLNIEFKPRYDYTSNLVAMVLFLSICCAIVLMDYYFYSRRCTNNKWTKKYYVFSESWYVVDVTATVLGQIGGVFMLVYEINSLFLVPMIIIFAPCLSISYGKRYNMLMKKSKKLIKEEKVAAEEKIAEEEKAAEKEKLMSAIRNEY